MRVDTATAIVTGAASGLGNASADLLRQRGCHVVMVDNSEPADESFADGERTRVVLADVRNGAALDEALAIPDDWPPVRFLIHCAGRGGSVRLARTADEVAPAEAEFRAIIDVNLAGTFNVLQTAVTRIRQAPLEDEERGVCVLTASIAAFEGQKGQIAYAASKSAVVGMTLVAARELSRDKIRVCSIAPGIFDTRMLARIDSEVKTRLESQVPHPSRLGLPSEYADLALSVLQNPMLNGETIRLDGALRM